MQYAIELVLFKLADGVSEEELLAAVAAMETDVQQMAGYIDRELSQTADGTWIDLLHWRSLPEAQQAAEQLMQLPSGQAFGQLIDFESIQMLHSHPHYREGLVKN